MPEVSAPHTNLTADESCALLTDLLRVKSPFFFTKFGDGLLELLYHPHKTHTCDGELYTAALRDEMKLCARTILESRYSYIGDWLSMTSGPAYYVDEYADLIGQSNPHWLHFEAVLLMRQSQALREFFEQLRDDPRRKVFMGPMAMKEAAKKFGAVFIPTPMERLHSSCETLYAQLRIADPQLLIWCAGMAGHIPVVRHWKNCSKQITCVNLGSSLDPIYRGRTRTQQLHPIQAIEFMRGIL